MADLDGDGLDDVTGEYIAGSPLPPVVVATWMDDQARERAGEDDAYGGIGPGYTYDVLPAGSGDRFVSDAARAVFDAANVNPYDEAGRFREASMRSAAESQYLGMKLAEQAREAAGWASLMARTRGGSAGRTVIDEAKLNMQQSAIDDALARGMEQLQSQYQMMADELNRQQELASDEIQRARLAALDSMTQLQQDLQQRSNQAQGDIMQSVGRTGGSIAAATQQALSRLGTTSNVVSEGIRRSLEEEGQVERGLAASQGDIQADLAARLGQISQGALDRQQGLVETQASGSSAELANLVAQITAQREGERAATEFELSEGARQQVLELMLNPPTKKVGGRAAGDLNKYALELEVLQGLGVPPAAALAAIVADKEGDVIESYIDPQYTEEDFIRDAFSQASPEQKEQATENMLKDLVENPRPSMFIGS